MKRIFQRFLWILPVWVSLAGCTMVSVTSEPPGAQITYSPTGTPPWRPWPPDSSSPRLTPTRTRVPAEPYYFLRAQKEGYYPTTPVFVDAKWLRRQKISFQLDPTPDLFARLQREKGLVLYEGAWVKPADKGIVEYKGVWMRPEEKFRLEQVAKGLVFDTSESRWMTPKEREALEVKRKEAQGLVYLKGQWFTREEADLQQLIDRQAQRMVESGRTFELRIERMGAVFTSGTEFGIADLSGHRLEVLLSGPNSRRVQVASYTGVTVHTQPGTYTLVVQPADKRTQPAAVARMNLEQGSRYATTYRGTPTGRPALSTLSPLSGEVKIPPPADLPKPVPLPSIEVQIPGKKEPPRGKKPIPESPSPRSP